jgi:hypothetical protein
MYLDMPIDPESVLEWTNYPNEGPIALAGYGGPTVCITVDPITPSGVVIHWSHGNDTLIERAYDERFRYLLQALPTGNKSWAEHPDKKRRPELFAHMADGSMADLLHGADAGGRQ